MRTFQYSDAKSHKFWNIEVTGDSFTVNYGKIGTTGQSQTKSFASTEKAQAEADKLVAEKTGKGYVETTVQAVVSDREALENAVRANPTDRSGYAIFSDYLVEKGDPLGEFMGVQLALENESLSGDKRKELKAQEKALLKKHFDEWIGTWAKLPDATDTSYEWTPTANWTPYRLTCGLLTGIEQGGLTHAVAKAISNAPTKFVHELIIHSLAYEEGEVEEEETDEEGGEDDNAYPSQRPMLRWPFLRQLRTFRFGGDEPTEYDDYCPYSCHTSGDHVFNYVKQMPEIEELHVMAHVHDASKLVSLPMPKLRTFLLYHATSYPLDRLAKNASLTNLAELYCHPHAQEPDDEPYINASHVKAICRSPHLQALTHLQLRSGDFGDEGVREIVSSGLLKRLKVLDLRHGIITDEGARLLASSPDLKNLTRLDLSRNRLGDAGVAALQATGVPVELIRQHGPNTEEWEFFSSGDIE